MKKWTLLIIAIVSCAVGHTEEPEKVGALCSKAILRNTNGYFVLSDRSCWKAIGFSKRWRSLSEWWNDVKLAPEKYECVPNDWFLGTQIEVYPKVNNIDVSEANASNQDSLKQCTHLLVNSRTGQVLFAIALEPADCIVQLYNEAHEDGYTKGYEKGRQSSYQNANEIYKNGQADGYKTGYKDGYRAGANGEQPGMN